MPGGAFTNRHKTWSAMRPRDYALAVVAVLVTVGLAFLVQRLLPHASLALLFLTSVLLVSSRTGLGPSLLASVLSFLAINFFFTEPFYTFKVADDREVSTLLFFLLIATITGNLAARMHREMAQHRASLLRTSNLYEFSRRLLSAGTSEEVLNALSAHMATSLQRPVEILKDSPDSPSSQAADAWRVFELKASRGGAVRVVVQGAPLPDEQLLLARNLCDQAAVALDRTQLAAELEKERLVSETEQLRSALLSSVSHDLRTPLASIIGSTSSLLEYGESFSAADRRELLTTVDEEARRLDRHIQNLLDMTRLGHGKVKLKRDWVDLHDVVAGASERLHEPGIMERLEVDIAPAFPLLWLHGALIEQAFVNLLDNALRFSPPEGRIRIRAQSDESLATIDICDEGPGIPVSEREKIFDMFYTARQGDRNQRQGTGLGLTICRGMVGAHGGTITAHDGLNGKGTCMRITLPVNQGAENTSA